MPLRLSLFSADVTPEPGHPLCASWYPPVIGVTDRLSAAGVVLFPPNEAPVVLCALEWSEVSNESHLAWRGCLAEAAGTSPERVAVHCTHVHNAPWPDHVANDVLVAAGGGPVMDAEWCEAAMRRVGAAVAVGLARPVEVTEVRIGQAQVSGIASNRRILGADGKVRATRLTYTADAAVRNEPEGLIDPMLRSLSFYSAEHAVAHCHFYTTHPTAFDRDGLVTCEFPGLARTARQEASHGTLSVYFTGCAGNITAGKYNEGTMKSRLRFARILEEAMKNAEAGAREIDISGMEWRSLPVVLPPRQGDSEETLMPVIHDTARSDYERSQAALRVAYLRRVEKPIIFGCLSFSREAALLFLPSEAFVEYQLFAQEQRAWVAVAAYGDCGPGYIPLARSFNEGGYEVTDSFVAPESEIIMRRAITELLGAGVVTPDTVD